MRGTVLWSAGCQEQYRYETYCVDLLNTVIVRDYQVGEFGEKFLWCRLANEKPDMVERVRRPRYENQETDEDGTDGIDIPDDAATDDGHGQTKGVDDDVIAVVNEEHMY